MSDEVEVINGEAHVGIDEQQPVVGAALEELVNNSVASSSDATTATDVDASGEDVSASS
jgi:hypothetical protein